MKILFKLFCILLCTSHVFAQSLQDSRVAYSYIYANFENAIIETLDDSKLSSKEEKLFKKFKTRLKGKTTTHFETYLTSQLKEREINMLSLDAVAGFSKSAMDLNGYPYILFPKKTIKKNKDKDVADYYVSTSLNISKPLTAVALTGMKPNIKVSIKLFDSMGQLVGKYEGTAKSEKKISSIGFAVSEKEGFSKIDLEHMAILHERMEQAILSATDECLEQLISENVN